MVRREDDDRMCAVHDEMQRRLDERWSTHVSTMESSFKDIKSDLMEIFNRLRSVEIRLWMFLGAIGILLFLLEKWPKLTALLK